MDPWLTQTKKTCPVCKQHVIRSAEDSDSEGEEGPERAASPRTQEEEEELEQPVSERTPLLCSVPAVALSPSFGSMDHSPPSAAPCLRQEPDQAASDQEEDEGPASSSPQRPLLV